MVFNDLDDGAELHDYLCDDCIAGNHRACRMDECECSCKDEPLFACQGKPAQ
jgi:hypothetical protein